MKKLQNGTWLACIIGGIAIASACGDGGDGDNPANDATGGKGGSGTGGKGGSKGGSSGDAGTSGNSGSSGTSGQGGSGATGGTNPGGDGGVGNESGGGTGGMPTECNIYDPNRPVEDIPANAMGDISFPASGTRTLTADTTWRINGRLYVGDGQTLNIEPCTLVVGTRKGSANGAGTLFVSRGGRLNAIGTADEPIVFSSDDYTFHPQAPWGGIVLLGDAPVGDASATPQVPETRLFEGLTDERARYGGSDAADNSGTLQYVRIEYGGDIIVSDKEINGLTMAGVGSGTTIDHIMVKRTRDDCFEWFGGTVDAHHLICENPGDDMFDTDERYRGHLQFLFGRLNTPGTSADPNGFEWDGNQSLLTAPERSQPKAANATLCGFGTSLGPAAFGALLRRNLQAPTRLVNTIITGFNNGFETRDNQGTNAAPTIEWTNSLFFENFTNNLTFATETDNDAGFDELAFINEPGRLNGITKPAGFECMSDPGTPPAHPFGNASVAGGMPGAGFEDPTADYIGAFDGPNDNWMTGLWVDWTLGD
jgi:hypothetical protein